MSEEQQPKPEPKPVMCACGLHPQHSDGYCPAEQTARQTYSEESGDADE